jgi:LDH2 family malate/lactate/ureidoglycolate dehydrogenase
MPTISVDALTQFARKVYEAAGTPSAIAQTVAKHQVTANLVGHDSHGVQLLPTYVERIDKGHIKPTMEPVVVKETPTTLFVNGQWGFGPHISEWTMRRLIDKARTTQVAVGSIREQSHVGRVAGYPTMATAEGFISMMMADSGQSPKMVAPFGGREPRLGTNPICIAFPSNLPGPVFIDMATSAVANGKLDVARAKGMQVPLGWLLDKDGRPSTDPEAQKKGGVMLPLGGPEGHKGYGLSFAVETLAAILPGLGFGIDPQGRHNDGVFMLVINPDAFREGGDFKSEVDGFTKYLKDTPPQEGFTEVLYPGEIEYRVSQTRSQYGVPIDDTTWGRLDGVATRFGLALSADS